MFVRSVGVGSVSGGKEREKGLMTTSLVVFHFWKKRPGCAEETDTFATFTMSSSKRVSLNVEMEDSNREEVGKKPCLRTSKEKMQEVNTSTLPVQYCTVLIYVHTVHHCFVITIFTFFILDPKIK
jgi:sensor c-di-GMP phosphodiesterase-like protein